MHTTNTHRLRSLPPSASRGREGWASRSAKPHPTMRDFIEATVRALQNGQPDLPALAAGLEQLSQDLEAIESQYAVGPEQEEDLRLALLQSLRLYQLSLELLRDCLEHPRPELLERALASAQEAELRLEEVEQWSLEEPD